VIALTPYAHGIHALDSGYGRPGHDAIHLLIEGERAAFIDTGTTHSVPLMLEALARLGLAPRQVQFVILTHIHLDHAGGAGALMRALPAAELIVHPRGARHMIDPTVLMAATSAVYGPAATLAMYGEVAPVAEARVRTAPHDTVLHLGERELLLIDTPGHARHHLTVCDRRSGHCFTGDTFGVSYRELDTQGRTFVFPSTSPSQFDPSALHRSIDLIASLQPAAVYVTHYSQVRDIPRRAADLHRLIDAHVDIARRERAAGSARQERIRAQLIELVARESVQQGWALQGAAAAQFMAIDTQLNAQGLVAWLDSLGSGAGA